MSAARRKELKALIEPFLTAMFNTALQITDNVNQAEEILYKAVNQAVGSFGNYTPGVTPRTWLFKLLISQMEIKPDSNISVVTNDQVDHFFIYKRLMDTEAAEERVSNGHIFCLIAENIRAVLKRLPLQHRLLIMLSDVEDFNYEEIAYIIELSQETVDRQLKSARLHLQQLLWQQVSSEFAGSETNIYKLKNS